MKILFLLHQADVSYKSFIKPNAPGFLTSGRVLVGESIDYISEIDALCDSNSCDAVVTTDYRILKVLFPSKKFKDPDTKGPGLTVLNFQGNTVYTPKGRKVLIVAPLRHLVTVPHAIFLFHRYMLKLTPRTSSVNFFKLPQIKVSYVDTVKDAEVAVARLSHAAYIAFDIETGANQKITHISFATVDHTYSFTIRDILDLHYIRIILLNDAVKIAQNGKYDTLHLIHWGCPIRNYYFDTYGLMSCWLAELPRSLDFLGSFFLDDLLYWKDESSSDMALYNAKDSQVTLFVFLSWMRQAPQWAKDNYAAKFPITFPHLASEFEGIAVDDKIWVEATLKQRAIVDETLTKLNECLGETTFNPGSPVQVKSLLKLLSPKANIDSSDEASLKKSAAKHPLNALLTGLIIKYREAKKLHSTYLDATLWHNRVTYSLNAFGTETGRSSCSASSFGEPIKERKDGGFSWRSYGVQLQNIPETYKICLIADPDFDLVEMDKSQAESRCTAYLAQELNMIEAVENSPDFHSSNAAAFFGIPFDELWDTTNHKSLNKAVRTVAKRVNHGANYNMGAAVLIQTMGEESLWHAKSLLKLPPTWGLREIAEYLLRQFDKTYPGLRSLEDGWYASLVAEWSSRQGLITTPDGWTRKFFGDPRKNKLALNAMVAHSPQHLNVAMVDKGYFRIWHELDDPKTFRVKGQIHDSVFFQVHKDHHHLIEVAKKIYDDTSHITVHGRHLFVPSDVSGPKRYWKDPPKAKPPK